MGKRLTKKKVESLRRYLEETLDTQPVAGVVASAVQTFGVSRQTVHRHLKQLMRDGVVEAVGQTKATQYRLRILQEFTQAFPLAGLEESEIWRWHAKSFFDVGRGPAMSFGNYCFTEMLNNAIDHSEGTAVTISMKRTIRTVYVVIHDDGVGVFKKIKDLMGLAEESHAVLEIAKGKLTSDPTRHSGMGIFFSSRAATRFTMIANQLMFNHFESGMDILLDRVPLPSGTRIEMIFDLNMQGSLASLFQQYAGRDHPGFSKTMIPVRLAEYGDENLISRSQAKRVLARVEHFTEVIWDFREVPLVGQAFADEIFRVFLLANPYCHFLVMNASPDVSAMIELATRSLREQDPTARIPEILPPAA